MCILDLSRTLSLTATVDIRESKNCVTLCVTRCIKMGRFLMTSDDEASSASYQQNLACVVETTADEV